MYTLEKLQSSVIIRSEGRMLRLTPMTPTTVRVTETLREAFLERPSDIIVPQTCAVPFTAEEDEGGFTVATPQLAVRFEKKYGSLSFSTADGRPLLREAQRDSRMLTETPVYVTRYGAAGGGQSMGVDGIKGAAGEGVRILDRTAYQIKCSFEFDPDEALYGLGSHEEGYGNLRGRMRQLFQHNLKACVPVLVSTKGWGIVFDWECFMVFHDDADGSYMWADCADELDYCFAGDGDYAGLMASLRSLTGAAPMLPRWTLGYIQSKERYVDAEEIVGVAERYRRAGVPLDCVVLDWLSWRRGVWGEKRFDPSRFPDPKSMTDRLHALGARFMISVWPKMGGADNADRLEFEKAGKLLGEGTSYDAFDPEARAMYWRQASRGLFAHGIDAWWCDCTEPFEADWGTLVKAERHLRAAINTDEAKRYLDPARVSAYSLLHSRGMYEGQRAECEDKRVVNLTRSSYAGQHRYATVSWSGDVCSKWDVLRRHVPEGMNFTATGEPYWSCDAGGFFVGKNESLFDPSTPNKKKTERMYRWFWDGDFDAGAADPGYRELYVRWLQYAMLLPMMRSHGTSTPREIWNFGAEGEPFYDAIKQAIELRMRLVPYLYSAMAQTHFTGAPMLRVPAMQFPADARLRAVDDELLTGEALLAKPVTHPMYYLPDGVPVEGASFKQSVYLPEGCGWYEFYTGERFEGGREVSVDAPLDRVPMFIRAGSILPLGSVAANTGEAALLPVELRVYPGADAAFTLYDDAGDGYGYEQGEYCLTRLSWSDAERRLTIAPREGGYPGMPKERVFTVRVAGAEVCARIAYRGQALSLYI